jgi:hypothetical protein
MVRRAAAGGFPPYRGAVRMRVRARPPASGVRGVGPMVRVGGRPGAVGGRGGGMRGGEPGAGGDQEGEDRSDGSTVAAWAFSLENAVGFTGT